jgi:Ca2+/Na+ antiporter
MKQKTLFRLHAVAATAFALLFEALMIAFASWPYSLLFGLVMALYIYIIWSKKEPQEQEGGDTFLFYLNILGIWCMGLGSFFTLAVLVLLVFFCVATYFTARQAKPKRNREYNRLVESLRLLLLLTLPVAAAYQCWRDRENGLFLAVQLACFAVIFGIVAYWSYRHMFTDSDWLPAWQMHLDPGFALALLVVGWLTYGDSEQLVIDLAHPAQLLLCLYLIVEVVQRLLWICFAPHEQQPAQHDNVR